MRKILFSILLSAKVIATSAQQPVIISASGGTNNTSSSVKDNSYLGNGYNLQANVLVPFLSSDNGKFSVGILAGSMYSTAKNLVPASDKLKADYKLYNGSFDINSVQNNGTTSSGFTAYLGVQADFSLGAFMLSPSVSGGYSSLKQGGFTESAGIMINGASQTITLADLRETEHKGFVMIPQLKIGYAITNTFSLYTSAGFNVGPKVDIEQRKLVPAEGFNSNNTYEPIQLSKGQMSETPTISCSYQTLMLNVGVSLSLGRKIKSLPKIPSRLSMTPTTAKQVPNTNAGEAESQATPAATVNPMYDDKGKATTNPIYESKRLIAGIILKGGKTPDGDLIIVTSDDNGGFMLTGLEKGIYKFALEVPDHPQGKSISEKGIKRQESTEIQRTYTGGRKNESQSKSISEKGLKRQESTEIERTYTAGRKNDVQSKSISEKGIKRSEISEMAYPGQPIKGVIVKGGKNPGGNMTNLTIDKDGTIQFEVLEAGDYKFLIEAGEGTNNTGSKEKKEKAKVVEKATSGLKDVVRTQV